MPNCLQGAERGRCRATPLKRSLAEDLRGIRPAQGTTDVVVDHLPEGWQAPPGVVVLRRLPDARATVIATLLSVPNGSDLACQTGDPRERYCR